MAQTTTAAAASTDTTPKAARLRSPSYPGIDLESAIKRAQEFYDQEKRNAANAEIAVKHWGFKPTSGGGFVVIAALKAFGLVSDTGSGKSRKIQLTDLALRIILDKRPDSPERDSAIKQAALMPKIHASLWTKYRSNLPSDENLKHELIFERKFNENTVGDFIKEYRDTIKFAKLADSDSIPPSAEDSVETSAEDWGQSVQDQQVTRESPKAANPLQTLATTNMELSIPVEFASEGQEPVIARLRFNAPIKKEYLTKIRAFLEAWEKTN